MSGLAEVELLDIEIISRELNKYGGGRWEASQITPNYYKITDKSTEATINVFPEGDHHYKGALVKGGRP
jgi:hypothetical protein